MFILVSRFKNIKSQDLPEVKCFMGLFKKIGRSLSVFALAPLSGLEKKERERRLEERLKRSEQKHSQN
jgi:hypothetical protein